MQCNCGGETEHEHKVVRNKVVVMRYQKCPACGRIKVTWKDPAFDPQTDERLNREETQ